MIEWYSFKPSDTLFFRGASPSQMGEDHSSISVFPPPSSTIIGALRTTVLIQNSIDFEKYGNNSDDIKQNIYDKIGKAGEVAPFNLIGPFFKYKDKIFIPAPYSWYFDKNEDSEKNLIFRKIFKMERIKNNLFNNKEIYWVKGDKSEVSSIGGKWITLNTVLKNKQECYHLKDGSFKNSDIDNKKDIVVNSSFFYSSEIRTGIALEKSRKVREGHLYSFTHARLKEDVKILWGVNIKLPIKNSGILKLGAEQRFGFYERIENINLCGKNRETDKFMSLSIIKGDNISNKDVISTGKIQYIGGWDMKKRFHKDMVGYYPAGTVFEKLDKNFIKIY